MSTIQTTSAAAPTRGHAPWSRSSRIGAVGVGGFFVAAAATAALTPGYSHVREAMSALAATDSAFAWLMITGFLACAVGLVATGAALWRRYPGGKAGRVAAALVTTSGLLMVVAGLARQDCSERLTSCIDHGEAPLASTHFWVHQYASLLLFVLLTVALFLLARAQKRSVGFAHLAVLTRVAGVLSLASIVALVVDPPVLDAYAGLVQRGFLVVLFGVPVLAAGLPARGAGSDAGSVAESAAGSAAG